MNLDAKDSDKIYQFFMLTSTGSAIEPTGSNNMSVFIDLNTAASGIECDTEWYSTEADTPATAIIDALLKTTPIVNPYTTQDSGSDDYTISRNNNIPKVIMKDSTGTNTIATLEVECYSVDLTYSSTSNPQKFTLQVYNNGFNDDTYDLEVKDKPKDWIVDLEYDQVEVTKGQTVDVEVTCSAVSMAQKGGFSQSSEHIGSNNLLNGINNLNTVNIFDEISIEIEAVSTNDSYESDTVIVPVGNLFNSGSQETIAGPHIEIDTNTDYQNKQITMFGKIYVKGGVDLTISDSIIYIPEMATNFTLQVNDTATLELDNTTIISMLDSSSQLSIYGTMTLKNDVMFNNIDVSFQNNLALNNDVDLIYMSGNWNFNSAPYEPLWFDIATNNVMTLVDSTLIGHGEDVLIKGNGNLEYQGSSVSGYDMYDFAVTVDEPTKYTRYTYPDMVSYVYN
ncbi:MAG: hypothetical protein GWN76_23270, partial [candidate division Zixibacteria bacterium]|nr:hypothetical protein [candidate division Zixibacteria bacterium]NIS48777.1 hypothetical protein [candidate division Zixibacteria bacterium]NIU16843.1 hypothetical protein [candidate division Zixibacteria bacterium]NIW97873.1 hypothetical protein [Phycisphaerae bacterium]